MMKGFQLIFEKEFPAFALHMVSSIGQMMKTLQRNTYTLAIIDIQLEDGISLNIIPDVIKLYPLMNVLIFTGYSEELYAQRLFNAGVKGFLTKNSAESEIIYALQTIIAGKTYFSEQYKTVLLNKKDPASTTGNPFNQLSARELQTAILLLQGKRSSQICTELNIQPSTVTTYKIKIFTKLGVNSVVDMERLATVYKVI